MPPCRTGNGGVLVAEELAGVALLVLFCIVEVLDLVDRPNPERLKFVVLPELITHFSQEIPVVRGERKSVVLKDRIEITPTG